MKKKICFIVTSPIDTKIFLIDYFLALSSKFDITLVANFSESLGSETYFTEISTIDVLISRKISLYKDITALIALVRIFRRERFDVVHSVTPKAGLLAMVAARINGVQARFHTFTGQVWATKRGPFRKLLKSLDKLTFHCASKVLVDSPSQRDFLLSEEVITTDRSEVLGMGSISGVNLNRFRPDWSARKAVRNEHGLTEDAFLFLYVGRANREKGLGELISAFGQLDRESHDAWLMLVGSEEDTILAVHAQAIQSFGKRFLRHEHTDTPERFMAAADVLCLPSHREGFGSVIIEAGACGIPSLASNIYGITDAINDGVTGILHAVRDSDDIATHMDNMATDRIKTRQMGHNAQLRVKERFLDAVVVQALVDFYDRYVV